ncbi:AMP-binding protein [Nonomuraea ferruginea]
MACLGGAHPHVVITLGQPWKRTVPPGSPPSPTFSSTRCAGPPGRRAVVAPDVRLTYAELGTYVFQLARHLQARGLRPEDVVAVATPRSAEMVVCVLAVMVAAWRVRARRPVLAAGAAAAGARRGGGPSTCWTRARSISPPGGTATSPPSRLAVSIQGG